LNEFSVLSDFNFKFSQKRIEQSSGCEKPPNGPMKDQITVDILKIDKNDFKGTFSPIEAKNFWLSKFGKQIMPLEKETYEFGSNDEDNSQKAVGTENSSAKMTLEKGISQFLPMG
jgi:hypothetical protein